MKIKTKNNIIEIHAFGLYCETFYGGTMCSVYKPGEISAMGQKLGTFVCKGMTLTELFKHIKTYTKLS
jgi:hypothetical protein